MAKLVKKPRKNGYKLPDPLPLGEILEDINKKKWILGPSIGKGGFGEIYSAREYTESSKPSKQYPYVIKIEPHANGPLFVEMHFYMRNAKPDEVDAFRLSKKMHHFGMPKYIASGSHQHDKQKYRFLVMEKFGSDIWKLFLENNRKFPPVTVFKLGIQILDVLEYIHSKGYVHADIKGANILLGEDSKNPKQVYLVDFGLASHFSSLLKPDPKKAHNGTIEYTSRDAHLGVQTRRGDLEILAYNLIQWLGCRLPWEENLDPASVQNSKNQYMNDIEQFLKTCFKNEKVPKTVANILKYITSLEVGDTPDYEHLRKILADGIKAESGSLKDPLEFNLSKKTPVKRKAARISGSNSSNVGEKKGNDKVVSKLVRKNTKKVRSAKPKEEKSATEDLNGSQILTQEMKRLKEKIEMKKANKKTKVTKVNHGRNLRSSNGHEDN
ncbi:nucleosomal histone kinase 1-like isoform X2 [Agrilus planipennis]|uniref:non-specific serine/threonine protein kinase n=2 Tax=Agrilus planipennis TaxID=224129 RepID=A0A7F5QY99_AGRPL|nr:nucleosomal histone kinase 1-like isoform X2 [Agrilus planipennis]